VGFVVGKVTLGQIFSEYFGFPCQFSFHRLLHTHHLSSGAGAIIQLVADVPSGLSLTPPQETKITKIYGAVTLLTPVGKAHGLNFGRETDYAAWGLHGLPQSLQQIPGQTAATFQNIIHLSSY
jgi:hypothetical protein